VLPNPSADVAYRDFLDARRRRTLFVVRARDGRRRSSTLPERGFRTERLHRTKIRGNEATDVMNFEKRDWCVIDRSVRYLAVLVSIP